MVAWVYIVANRYRGTTYIGVTTAISRRALQHREGEGAAFAARYRAKRLVHIEEYPTVLEAISREKALKKWLRDWKIELIETHNPDRVDLFETLNA